ncbi:EVE domain-containing protein [Fulvivirga sedimenti]|uniref:EVE domain-containing protein n=1 Tax=Fulvivirga sedimenti TaxID=2879465 RepID=A0A9X1HP43_9BACT|nr:EVE domain-containing protein [Fulvivirga sedimenti]MCA6075390.1 EVE domain-containing protein [Fulvivirga sedimenti]MCA6076567.1 EVE domain-containing protein [Fulvivirga sedimenti]MCA6077695.1 EVE domain-containing protein [Fulvivirga sedimenti]
MNYWLLKTEPGTYSWDDLLRDGRTFWDGVRNYQARNYMKEMKSGDLALYYHSVNEKRILGIARVVKESYQDPSTDDDRWVAVDIEPESTFEKPVTLADIKGNPALSNMVLVRNSRLSVQPVTKNEFDLIIEKSKN